MADPREDVYKRITAETTKVNYERMNILQLGKQHAGKSSVINTFAHVCFGKTSAECPTGRRMERGTLHFEKNLLDGAIEIRDDNILYRAENVTLFDIAGFDFKKNLEANHKSLIFKVLGGIKEEIDTNDDNWQTKVVEEPKNKIDLVTIVLNARDLVQNVAQPTTWSNYLWTGVREISTQKIDSVRAIHVVDIADMIRRKEGYFPAVVVTHMDMVPTELRRDVIETIERAVHETNIFTFTTWDQSNRRKFTKADRTEFLRYLRFAFKHMRKGQGRVNN